tara:strand:+ start:691 stop:864 length:174 start_codon:yes stop_codon:yes gene_type:complete
MDGESLENAGVISAHYTHVNYNSCIISFKTDVSKFVRKRLYAINHWRWHEIFNQISI